jgi:hypothetical protein
LAPGWVCIEWRSLIARREPHGLLLDADFSADAFAG